MDGRLCRFSIIYNDKPGALAKLSTLIGQAGAKYVCLVLISFGCYHKYDTKS